MPTSLAFEEPHSAVSCIPTDGATYRALLMRLNRASFKGLVVNPSHDILD
jgi:hypothetical protein